MAKKIQVWFRQDQAECVVHALEYCAARCKERRDGAETNTPGARFAGRLAYERIADVMSLFVEAMPQTTALGEKP